MIATIKLINVSNTSHSYHFVCVCVCVCVVRTFKISSLSKFQVYDTISLIRVTYRMEENICKTHVIQG